MSWTIHQGDALEVLRTLPDTSADAIITDPPYCSGGTTEAAKARSSHQGLRSETIRRGRFDWFDGDNMTTAGLSHLLREMAVQALRIVKPSGHLLVFADWRMVPSLVPAIESAGVRYRSLIVWDKGGFGCGIGFRPQHEMIMHFTGASPTFHATDIGNVIRASRVPSNKRCHPTEKPIELLCKLIRVVTPKGGVVVDPFAGSGSTALACEREGRSSILIERDSSRVSVAKRRIAEDAPPS